MDHRDSANPFQRRRRIGRCPHDDDRIDQRLETADISGWDERFDLGARGGDQQDEAFGEVDGPSEQVPRTLRRQRYRRQPQVFFMTREMAGDPAVLQR